MSEIVYPCPECGEEVGLDVQPDADWWSATCGHCGHTFELWRCPGEGHISRFKGYRDGDAEGLRCLNCGHEHEVLRTDEKSRRLREAMWRVKELGPQFFPLLRVVQGAMRQRLDELNPGHADSNRQDVVPCPINRRARRLAEKAAEKAAAGKLTASTARKLQRGIR